MATRETLPITARPCSATLRNQEKTPWKSRLPLPFLPLEKKDCVMKICRPRFRENLGAKTVETEETPLPDGRTVETENLLKMIICKVTASKWENTMVLKKETLSEQSPTKWVWTRNRWGKFECLRIILLSTYPKICHARFLRR